MTLKYRSLVICNLPIIVVETTVTFIESSSKLSRCGLLNNTLAWHYVIIYSKAIAPASVWTRELVWWLICTSISISMVNWFVQLGQGCDGRRDRQDQGLTWILQNRTWWPQRPGPVIWPPLWWPCLPKICHGGRPCRILEHDISLKCKQRSQPT